MQKQPVEGYLQHVFKVEKILLLNKEKLYCTRTKLDNLRKEFKKKTEP